MIDAIRSGCRAALVGLLAFGAVPATAQDLDPRFAQAMAICLDNYPDFGAARRAALTAGFRSEGRMNGFDVYTAYRRDLLAGYSASLDGCIIGLDGLRDQSAIEATGAAVASKFGTEVVRLGNSADGYYLEGWVAATPAGGVLIAVRRQETARGSWRGSLIEVRPYELDE